MKFQAVAPSPQLKLNFRQWSRKSYAVFCSLGKQVRISVLKVDVTAEMASKNKPLGYVDEMADLNLSAERVDEEDDLPNGNDLFLQLASNVVIVSNENEAHILVNKNIIIPRGHFAPGFFYAFN
jgi:hypothetical protein